MEPFNLRVFLRSAQIGSYVEIEIYSEKGAEGIKLIKINEKSKLILMTKQN